MTEREVTRRAHAKINLCLRVLGRRDDGFHDIESVILPLSLHDLVTVRAAEMLTVELTGDLAAQVPTGEDNLAVVAARALGRALDRPAAAAIDIDKRIPVAAGLGGGSADAAATLESLHELWEGPLDDAELAEVAASIGSDVPALLDGGPVVVEGRGERVRSIGAAETWWAVRPMPFGVRAADAYDWWDAGERTGPPIEPALEALAAGTPEPLAAVLSNDLQDQVAARHPEIADTIAAFEAAGALAAFMSGSGPTVVALAWNEAHAERLVDGVPGAIVASGLEGRGAG